MRTALIAAALVCFVTPVLAATPAATPAPAADTAKKSEKDDPNRIVCKRQHVVGSNRPQKVCMTVAERDRLQEQSQRITDESRRSGVSRDNNGNLPGSD